MKNSFANNLRNLRIENNMSQSELARQLYINRSMICAYEKENRMPSLDVLMQLSAIFNVSVDFLLGTEKDAALDKERSIDITGLNQSQIDIIKNLINEFRNKNK